MNWSITRSQANRAFWEYIVEARDYWTNLLSSINACQTQRYPPYYSLMAKRKFLTAGHLFANAAIPFHRAWRHNFLKLAINAHKHRPFSRVANLKKAYQNSCKNAPLFFEPTRWTLTINHGSVIPWNADTTSSLIRFNKHWFTQFLGGISRKWCLKNVLFYNALHAGIMGLLLLRLWLGHRKSPENFS